MGNDELIMPYISSANIACGYHAGDEKTMQQTVELCKKYNVAVGAHPSYPDKENFGRTDMLLHPGEIYEMIVKRPASLYQKIPRAITQLIIAPYSVFIPVNTFTPRPQPAIFPILNIKPPNAIKKARKNPKPGRSLLAISCALFSLTLTIRQIFICVPISRRIEIRITKPKLVSSCSVNKDV